MSAILRNKESDPSVYFAKKYNRFIIIYLTIISNTKYKPNAYYSLKRYSQNELYTIESFRIFYSKNVYTFWLHCGCFDRN